MSDSAYAAKPGAVAAAPAANAKQNAPQPKAAKAPDGSAAGFKEVTSDPLLLSDFNSAYNTAVGQWSYISQRQVLAIDSIANEAKKPDKPDLEEELLVSLALGAFSGLVSVLGMAIARTIDKEINHLLTDRLVQDVANNRWLHHVSDNLMRSVSNEEAKWIRETAGSTARYLGEYGKDAFKDGLKNLTGPRIRELLKGGKLPIDAFFEGKKLAAVDAASAAARALESKRTSTLKDDPSPVITAQALAKGITDNLKQAEETQKAETLRQWLRYQAQLALGSHETGRKMQDGTPETATNLGRIPGEHGGAVPNKTPGVLFIDIYPTLGISPGYQLMGAALPGLSRAMLVQLETPDRPVKDLGLPIIFRIVADTEGRGFYSPAGPHTADEWQFTVVRDESGAVYHTARHPWHKRLLTRWVGGEEDRESDVQRGAEGIAYLTSELKLKQLHISPDKE